MSLLAAIRKSWSSIAPRNASDVEEEFRSTLDAYQEDLIRQGLSEEDARRKARIDLGRPDTQNEAYRDAIGLRLLDELGGDVRYCLRALRRNRRKRLRFLPANRRRLGMNSEADANSSPTRFESPDLA